MDWLTKKLKDPEFIKAFCQDWFMQEFLIQVEDQMSKQGMNQALLAKKSDLSPAFINDVFKDRRPNLTVATLVKIMIGLKMKIKIEFVPL